MATNWYTTDQLARTELVHDWNWFELNMPEDWKVFSSRWMITICTLVSVRYGFVTKNWSTNETRGF